MILLFARFVLFSGYVDIPLVSALSIAVAMAIGSDVSFLISNFAYYALIVVLG
jgi:hypothetical protein